MAYSPWKETWRPLPEIVKLAKQYNASVMVDEAHGIGVFGRQGRGTCDHFGVANDVDLIMGTFSKITCLFGRVYRNRLHYSQLHTTQLPFIHIQRKHHSGIDSCRIGCPGHYGKRT